MHIFSIEHSGGSFLMIVFANDSWLRFLLLEAFRVALDAPLEKNLGHILEMDVGRNMLASSL